MKREYGDSVLIGASSTKHIEQNLIDLEKGPLRESLGIPDLRVDTEVRTDVYPVAEEVLKVLDEAWLSVMPFAKEYFH